MSCHYRSQTLFVFFLFYCHLLPAQTFERTEHSLRELYSGKIEWADLDSDNDLDLIYFGANQTANEFHTLVYRNDAGAFNEVSTSLRDVRLASFALGDYDRDGDLDVLISGLSSSGGISELYQNNGAFDFVLKYTFPGITNTTASWFDIDNDEDLDFLIAGVDEDSFAEQTLVYENTGAEFTRINDTNLPFCTQCSMSWADANGDGKVDLAVTGFSGNSFRSALYLNNGDKTFHKDERSVLTDFFNGSLAWGDFDNDGDMDLLLSGAQYTGIYGFVYENNGHFLEKRHDIAIEGASENYYGGALWMDYDNDGYLDILIAGRSGSLLTTGTVTKLYKNDGNGGFQENTNTGLTELYDPSFNAADFDNDGDVDLCFIGGSGGTIVAGLYQNLLMSNAATANSKPLPPGSSSFSEKFFRKEIELSWDKGSDSQTPDDALTYNFYLRNADINIVMPNSSISSGVMLSTNPANGHGRNVRVNGAPEGEFFWRVQSIDGAKSASAFSFEKAGYLVYGPQAVKAQIIDLDEIELTWLDNSMIESGYEISRSKTSSSGFQVITTTPAEAEAFTDLHNFLTESYYYYRIRALNANGASGYDSLRVVIPAAPQGVSTEPMNASTIHVKWSDMSDFETGYVIERKLSADATFHPIMTLPSNTEAYLDNSLVEGTSYDYRVRAINEYGNSGHSNESTAQTNWRPHGADFSKEVPEDTPLIFTPLDFSNHFIDQDPEDVLVSVVIVTLPEKGSLLFGSTAIVAGQEISKGSLADVAFLPERDSNGTFSFKIRVSDGKDLSGTTSSVAIMILPVNDTPAFTIGSNLHESEDFTAPIIVKASPLPVPQDESSQTITYTLFPATSRLVSIELNAATGELRFASVLNEHGAEDFIITANDGQADNNVFSATIKVNILPVNDPPVLSVIPDQAVDFLGEMLPIAISVEDVDDPLASVVLSAKSDNTLVIKNEKITFSGEGVERQIHIDPEERRHGEVTISVSATDGKASALREFRVVLFTITSALDLPMGNLTVTPNPARHTVYVRSNASPDKPLVLVIKDALGRDILHEVISQHDASIDVRNLSSGMYLLTISGRHHRSRQIRLVKE